jgi:hypothetical protein
MLFCLLLWWVRALRKKQLAEGASKANECLARKRQKCLPAFRKPAQLPETVENFLRESSQNR